MDESSVGVVRGIALGAMLWLFLAMTTYAQDLYDTSAGHSPEAIEARPGIEILNGRQAPDGWIRIYQDVYSATFSNMW